MCSCVCSASKRLFEGAKHFQKTCYENRKNVENDRSLRHLRPPVSDINCFSPRFSKRGFLLYSHTLSLREITLRNGLRKSTQIRSKRWLGVGGSVGFFYPKCDLGIRAPRGGPRLLLLLVMMMMMIKFLSIYFLLMSAISKTFCISI